MLRELSDRRARRRWSREMHRRLAELDRIDRVHGLGALPTASTRRRTRRNHGAFWPSLLVTVLVLAGVLLLAPGVSAYRVRTLLGIGNDRLNSVVAVPHGGGHFRFQRTQPGSDDPVSYDPCREIEYVVNPAGAPPDHQALVARAVSVVSQATGFRFTDAGTTDSRAAFDQSPHLGVTRSPVLIEWAAPDEVPELAGRVVGLGGSTPVQRTPDHLTYVTGVVALDRDVFAEMSARPHGFELQQAILMHELGHVVGLAHVKDANELMYDDNVGRTSFGPGDLEGLARLGAVACG